MEGFKEELALAFMAATTATSCSGQELEPLSGRYPRSEAWGRFRLFLKALAREQSANATIFDGKEF